MFSTFISADEGDLDLDPSVVETMFSDAPTGGASSSGGSLFEFTFGAVWFGVIGFILLVFVFMIFVWVRNYRAAKRQGMDPFAVQTEVAGKLYNSALLAPPPAPGMDPDDKSARLQEIETLFRSGSIDAAERQRARDAILAE